MNISLILFRNASPNNFFTILFPIGFLSYLLGSISFGLIIAKIFKLGDLRKQGSGNIGASNIMRISNKSFGVATLILDALKGAIPIIVCKYLNFCDLYIIIAGLFAVIGHMWPIWHKFNGGKGVATTFGIILTLNLYTGVIFALFWLSTFFAFRIASVASLFTMLISPIVYIFFTKNLGTFVVLFIIFLLIVYKHKTNINNLIKNKENKFNRKDYKFKM